MRQLPRRGGPLSRLKGLAEYVQLTPATGSPEAVRQFLRTQPACQRVKPFLRYSLSVCNTTTQGRFRLSSATAAAVSSMRLLVVAVSAPVSSRSTPL